MQDCQNEHCAMHESNLTRIKSLEARQKIVDEDIRGLQKSLSMLERDGAVMDTHINSIFNLLDKIDKSIEGLKADVEILKGVPNAAKAKDFDWLKYLGAGAVLMFILNKIFDTISQVIK